MHIVWFGLVVRHERPVESDAVAARACRNVPGDARGRISDSIDADSPRPVDSRPATCRAVSDDETCRRQPHQLPGLRTSSLYVSLGCLQLLEMLEISWNLKLLLEMLEISWNSVDAPGKFYK